MKIKEQPKGCEKVLKEIEKKWNNETQIGYSDLAMQEAINLTLKYRNAEVRKEIEEEYKKVCREWDKKVLIHVNSKESKIKGYVTDEEHITGERASKLEGEIKCFEKILNTLYPNNLKVTRGHEKGTSKIGAEEDLK